MVAPPLPERPVRVYIESLFGGEASAKALDRTEQNNLENEVMYYFYLDQFNLHGVFIRRGHRAKQRCSKTT